ncbi:hypothetical protein KSP40_PGU015402 [Platanthera guangdongensis]|uniref:Uncharacterized protein n=1 Tax=Platanthera guangdongensis TaxID=2320717 RepID=A0ABR2MRU8_9ASPA
MADKTSDTLFSDHVQLKIPAGDSPYVKAKHVQLVEKDPQRAIALFWRAINSADRVDSALKDMAVVMKQLNRAEEAIEAIKSFRGFCSAKAQEPLDNVLLDLYKKCGRIDEQIELLNRKLRMIDEGMAFGGRITKMARSQGKKFHVTIEQEKSRLLGNLAWAYMQYENYKEAEPLYRRALAIERDYNKMCNLSICLLQTGRHEEAKTILQDVETPADDCNGESYLKSFERAWEIMDDLNLKQFQTAKSNGNHESLSDNLSPLSVKVTPHFEPVAMSEYPVERKKTDIGTEKLVITVDIQMQGPGRKHFVISSEKAASLPTKNQIFLGSKASIDENSSPEISFGSLDLSSEQKLVSLFTNSAKKTWADMVEEDEQLACENSVISKSTPTLERSEFGSHGGNEQSESRTLISSWKNFSKNETQSLKTGYQKHRISEYQEQIGRRRRTAKKDKGEIRSFAFDRREGCNPWNAKLESLLMDGGGKICEDSDHSCKTQRNRLQVFEELAQGDAKV